MPTATKTTTLVSLATAKAYIGIPADEDTADVLIAQIADAVSEKFEAKTGRRIVTRTGLTETWNGDGRAAHFLRVMDVIALASLTVDDVTVSPTDVAVDGRLGKIQLKPTAAAGAFSAGIGNCTAVYSAGFGAQDAVALPSDVIECCLEWMKAIYDEKSAGATSASSVSIGPSSLVIKPGLGFNIKSTIDAWMDVRG